MLAGRRCGVAVTGRLGRNGPRLSKVDEAGGGEKIRPGPLSRAVAAEAQRPRPETPSASRPRSEGLVRSSAPPAGSPGRWLLQVENPPGLWHRTLRARRDWAAAAGCRRAPRRATTRRHALLSKAAHGACHGRQGRRAACLASPNRSASVCCSWLLDYVLVRLGGARLRRLAALPGPAAGGQARLAMGRCTCSRPNPPCQTSLPLRLPR